ncbi:MAG TPA: DUF4168 domain-containing protein [Gillisia sp.]|nr:DUF4168 domain-containing protein [Gillisia sp.]
MFRMKGKMNVMMLCAGLFVGTTAIAQTPQLPPQQQQQQQVNVTDAELEKFAEAYQGIQVAQQEAQKKMISAVEEQGMEIGAFNDIHQAKMQNQEVEASQEDLQKHAKAVEKIEQMQPAIQAEMEEIITGADLTIEKYEQIAAAMQTNPELLQRLQKIMAG